MSLPPPPPPDGPVFWPGCCWADIAPPVTEVGLAPTAGAELTTEFGLAGLTEVALVVLRVLITLSAVELPVADGPTDTVPLELIEAVTVVLEADVVVVELLAVVLLVAGTTYFKA